MSSAAKYTVGISTGIVAGIVAVIFSTLVTFTGCRSAPLPDGFSFVFPLLFFVPPKAAAETVRAVLAVISMAQFPTYGWLLARAWVRGSFSATLVWLSIGHGVAALAGLWIQASL